MRRWAGLVGLALLALAWALSWVLGYDVVLDVHPGLASEGPGLSRWLGTDHLGRDVARRLVVGTQAFVGPALAAAALAVGLGGGAGALAGWWGGAVAGLLRYALSVLASLPTLVAALLACAVLGDSVWVLAGAVGLGCAPGVGEAVYARVHSLRAVDFVAGLQAHGVHPARVLLYHVLWVSCRGLLARQALLAAVATMTVETTLSYIGGFGVPEPQPSWGNMIAFEWQIPGGNPWAWAAPALALWAVVWSASLTADALAEGRDG